MSSAPAADLAWRPALGAWPERGGVRSRVWAPLRREVELVLIVAAAMALDHV